ncbi:MAG: substrate-binding domain-containing protein [Deltaproteobacteria bacterium]|nr:substrate-binding domain-containing protein [Deltaproteobacteria bacterium]
MRHQVQLSTVVLAMLAGACGGMGERRDGGGGPGDTAEATSPFVPVAIEQVIASLVDAITEKNLAPSAKPAVAVLLKDVTGFWAPIAVGADRMSGTLLCPKVVEAPLIVDESVPEDVKAVEQNGYIQKYLDEGIYQAMAVAPFSATGASVDYLNAFVAKCGPVVTIDSDSPNSRRSYNIGTANYQAGVTAALTLSKVLSPGDTVAVFGTTDANWVSGMQRAQGAEDGARAAGLNVAPRIAVVWNTTIDMESIVAAISDPALDIKGLLCMYSNSDRCAAAVEAVGKKGAIQIVGFDLEPATKAYFDQGYFYGIAVQRQYYMGALSILVPFSIETLGPARTAELLQPILVDGFLLDTGIDIITSDTFESYVAYLSSLGINP